MEQLTDLKAILHSKRANIYYVEKCRVMQIAESNSVISPVVNKCPVFFINGKLMAMFMLLSFSHLSYTASS
jgi:hypothetical protein